MKIKLFANGRILASAGLLLFSFFSCLANAQGAWSQKVDFGGVTRYGAVAFSIGNKGYIGTGESGFTPSIIYHNDFWEWDQTTNVWTQKANFAGGIRYGAVGFSIGSKGYIGTGADGSASYRDFWEWNQSTNTWTQLADIGGLTRYEAVGFSIGANGYIGTGFPNADFWEYNSSSDTWTQKTSFPFYRYYAVGFSAGGKGYVGLGTTSNTKMNDFWEYDTTTNAWTQKADFGGLGRENATGFVIGTKIYIGTGYKNNSPYYTNDFWEWDQITNTWVQIANLPGIARREGVGFAIGAKGYISTGANGLTTLRDFWEWNSNCSLNITGSSTTLLCGTSLTLNANYSPANSNVVYSWSPAFGLSSTTVSNPSAAPNVTTTYTLIAQDTATQCIGTALFQVTVYPPGCTITGASNICIAGSSTLSSVYSPLTSNVVYSWSPTSSLNNSTIANPIASPSANTTYTLIAQDTLKQCSVTKTFNVSISNPVFSIGGPYSICQGQNINLCASNGVYYSWSSGQTTNCISVSPLTDSIYSVDAWNALGCHGYDTTSVFVNCTGTSSCSNEDFETGNFNNWTALSGVNTGSCTPSWAGGLNFQGNDLPPSYSAQHTILTINSLNPVCIDPNTNQPDTLMTTLAPGGGNFSVRLGNSQAGYGAEGLRIQLSPTTSDSIFSYQFACVFQDPGHSLLDQPGLRINVYDSSNILISNLSDTIRNGDPLYSFISSPAASIKYKRWSAVNLNLSPYIGQMITIEFANFDCGQGGHFGYTYLDVSCNPSTSNLSISSITSQPLLCFGQCNGSATVNASGGVGPYTYLWNNGQTTQTATGLCAGNYTVNVSDIVITQTASVTVTQPSAIVCNLGVADASACTTNDGSIQANVSGGVSPYSYLWSTGQTTFMILNLFPNTYTVTVTDANGCTLVDTGTVNCPTSTYGMLIGEEEIFISPNPTSGIFTIDIRGKECEITIINILGEKIYSEKMDSDKTKIDLSEERNGIYFLQIKTIEGIVNRKIIIQK